MILLITRVVSFLWTTFAPEQAKEDMQLIAKDFVRVLAWLIGLSFVFGALFFAGLYFLSQWLLLYIDHTIACYLIGTVVSLFFVTVITVLVFRYIVLQFLNRAQVKADQILKAFSFKK